MSKRKVFGRRRVNIEGGQYTIEMREDGVFMRRRFGRQLVHVPFEHLVKLFEPQLSLNFYDRMGKDIQGPPLPDLQQGQLVHHESQDSESHLHAGSEPAHEAVQGRPDGLDTPTAPGPEPENTHAAETTEPAVNQLPEAN